MGVRAPSDRTRRNEGGLSTHIARVTTGNNGFASVHFSRRASNASYAAASSRVSTSAMEAGRSFNIHAAP